MNLKSLVFLSVLLSCSSCIVPRYEAPCDPSYEDAIAVTLDAWFSKIGGVMINGCARDLDEFEIVDVETIDLDCPSGGIGCILPGKKRIEILADMDSYQRGTTLIHEIIHLMSRCVDNTTDPQHLRKELWNEYGHDTVESVATHNICLSVD